MRLEFSRATRRDALQRSGKLCEAVGAEYGLKPGERCCAPLAKGVEFDHHLSAEMGGDNSLDNCRAVCIPCHRRKTAQDIRAIRKSDRQRDKNSGAWKPKFPSRWPPKGSRPINWRRANNG